MMLITKVDRRYLRTLFEWHGGQSSGVYSVASCGLAGRPVPLASFERAADELRRDLDAAMQRYALRCFGNRIGCPTARDLTRLRAALRYLETTIERVRPMADLINRANARARAYLAARAAE